MYISSISVLAGLSSMHVCVLSRPMTTCTCNRSNRCCADTMMEEHSGELQKRLAKVGMEVGKL